MGKRQETSREESDFSSDRLLSHTQHSLIVASYGLTAFAVALLLPDVLPRFDSVSGGLVGWVVFLSAALLHNFLARKAEARQTQWRLLVVKRIHDRMQDELSQMQTKFFAMLEHSRVTGRRREDAERMSLEATPPPSPPPPPLSVEESDVEEAIPSFLKEPPSVSVEEPPKSTPQNTSYDKTVAEVSGVELIEDSMSDSTVIDLVRTALIRRRVELYVQPVVSLPQRRRHFFEAYSWVRTDEGRTILPGRYLDLAYRMGLVETIDHQLIKSCVYALHQLSSRNVAFFCNISPQTLQDEKFWEPFLPRGPRLILELPQERFERHLQDLLPSMERLGKAGVRFSLDHVTTLRDSSLYEHVHFIKLDADHLVSSLTTDKDVEDFKTFQREAKKRSLTLVLEKVETEAVLVELLDYNIPYGEGLLFGEPRLSKLSLQKVPS